LKETTSGCEGELFIHNSAQRDLCTTHKAYCTNAAF